MTELKIVTNSDGVATMSSIDMVAYINSTREQGKHELRHDNFMNKVVKVLGIDAPKFLGTQQYGNNITREVYHFPEEEAMRMAMSYSYELQHTVLKAWKAAQALLSPVAIPVPTSYAAALRLAAEQAELVEKTTLALSVVSTQLEEAMPAIAFKEAVMADSAVYSMQDAGKLLGFGPNKLFKKLREAGYLRKNNTPYSQWTKYLESSFSQGYLLPDGTLAPPTTYMTGNGLVYFKRVLNATDKHTGELV